MPVLHDSALALDAAVTLNGKSLLNDEFMSVIGAHDRRALDTAIRAFTSTLGFDRYNVCVIHDDFSSEDSCLTVSMLHNTPPEYFREWVAYEAGRVDPVMQHCKRSSAPIVYGQDTYVSAGAAEKWEHQAPFGFGYGIGSAIHLPQHQHVFFGVDRRSPIRASRNELTELVARVHLFGTFVQCTALSC